jgi:hypothetical protein
MGCSTRSNALPLLYRPVESFGLNAYCRNMKRHILLILLLALPTLASASDWRVHLPVCNQDAACAKEQALARDLWDKQNWTQEFKDSCRKQYIQSYSKDYRAAVACVTALEEKKQEFDLRQAEIDRKNKENKSYRTWGGVIIK